MRGAIHSSGSPKTSGVLPPAKDLRAQRLTLQGLLVGTRDHVELAIELRRRPELLERSLPLAVDGEDLEQEEPVLGVAGIVSRGVLQVGEDAV